MPAVIRQYIEKGTFEGTLDIQRQLIEDYKEDIRKYADGMDQTRILNVLSKSPISWQRTIRSFKYLKWPMEHGLKIIAAALSG